jgi:hypothetical protein
LTLTAWSETIPPGAAELSVAATKSMTEPASTPLHADAALAVYLEPHARDARVLVFEAEGGALGERLERVTRDVARIPRDGRVPATERAFDLIVAPDGEPLAQAGRIDALCRALARGGLLVIALREPGNDAPRRSRRGERERDTRPEDLVAQRLKNVRVLTQSPIAGFALVDPRSQAELSIDSRLVRGKAPEVVRRVIVASDAALPEEGKLWVEVPPAPVAESVDARVYESLRRAEDDAREALRREGELLRELEVLRRAEEQAVVLEKRARTYEQKLLSAEADYDDAVAKVRYFEAQVSERERALGEERAQREKRERELKKLESAFAKSDDKLARADAEAKAARAEAESARSELAELEERLRETSAGLRTAQADQKRAETVARDAVEELRRLEHGALERTEHDARVQELSAERDRAVQRALDAEVARESAQLRADELRAELLEQSAGSRGAVVDEQALIAVEVALQDSESARAELARELDDARAALADSQSALAAAGERLLELDRALADRERGLTELQGSALRSEALAVQIDTLQAELLQLKRAQREPVAAPSQAALSELSGERTGLLLRVREAESALRSAFVRGQALEARVIELSCPPVASIPGSGALSSLRERAELADAERERAERHSAELAQRVAELDAELTAARGEAKAAVSASELDELRDALARAEQRIDDLSRELDEADRIAAVHAEDDGRIETLEGELEAARRHMDELDDDVRGRDEEMRTLREESEARVAHSEAKAEESQRREAEARAERDAAHTALSEARSILSQLASRVGADASDPNALMEALDRNSVPPALVDALRTALDEAQRDRREAIERAGELERRVSELESPPPAPSDPAGV